MPNWGRLAGVLRRLEQVLGREKGIDVVEVRVDQDKVAVCFPDGADFLRVETVQLGPQHVVAWIAGDVNRKPRRDMRIMSPEVGIVLAPGKQVRNEPDRYRRKPPRVVDLGRQVHQGFLVPGEDLMPEAAHDLKHFEVALGHALVQVQPAGKGGDLEIDLAVGSDDGGETPACGNARQQQLGVQLAYLVFNGDDERCFMSHRDVPEG